MEILIMSYYHTFSLTFTFTAVWELYVSTTLSLSLSQLYGNCMYLLHFLFHFHRSMGIVCIYTIFYMDRMRHKVNSSAE